MSGAKRTSSRLTAADRAVFEREVRRLVKLWRLDDWDVGVAFRRLPGKRAQCYRNPVGRIATITLSSEWNAVTPVSRAALIQTARHEVAHVILGEVGVLATARYVTSDELCAAEEACVNRLVNLLP